MTKPVLFRHMDAQSRRFYSRIFNTVLLNLWAVRNGLYSTLLCETESPSAMILWRAAVPGIIEEIERRRSAGGWAEE